MNIREAIFAAAAKIESEPQRFDFDSVRVPGMNCGSPGCAIGWIAAYRGQLPTHCWPNDMVPSVLGINDGDFYDRMDELEREHIGEPQNGYLWMREAAVCAWLLRKYADKHHPAHEIPASVRAIFETKQTEAAIQSFL